MIPIALGAILLTVALCYTVGKAREFERSSICNISIVDDICGN